METGIKKGITPEVIDRLERYRRTLISPSCFERYNSDPKQVVHALNEKGFVNCRCWISRSKDWLTGEEDYTILIEGERKEVRK